MDIDFNALSKDELKEINKKSAAALANYEERQRKEAIAKAREIAKSAGFSSLEEMLASTPRRKTVDPKYRHPENAELTWTGRGRKPLWVVEALEAGKSLEDLAI